MPLIPPVSALSCFDCVLAKLGALNYIRKKKCTSVIFWTAYQMTFQLLLLRTTFVNLCELISELDETALEDFRASSKTSSTSIVHLVCKHQI